MTDVPRFTGCLRAYAGSSPNDPYSQQQLREELSQKRKNKNQGQGTTWEELNRRIKNGKDPKSVSKPELFCQQQYLYASGSNATNLFTSFLKY